MSHKGIFEDSDEFSEEESGEDFSASEEDWKPGKDDKASYDDDDYDDDDDDDNYVSEVEDDDEPISKKSRKSKVTKKSAKTPKLGTTRNRFQTGSLRSKLFRRYNPPPKTGTKLPVPTKVADISSGSQYTKRKQMPSASTSTSGSAQVSALQSDSESSDDEGLVNPNEIDFNSDFFDVKSSKHGNQKEDIVPTFDCNAGMNLSDSSDEDDEDSSEVAPKTNNDTAKKPSIVDQINKKSSNEMHDFSSLQTFAKNLESAKTHLAKLKEKEASTSKASTEESDITKLLSLGEGSASVSTPSSRRRKHKDDRHHSDDSEWENVSDDDGHVNQIKDIQITVGNEAVRGMTRDQKRAIDLEACLKRRLNRDIKEKQVFLHKTAVLCWIAHGNYINRVLNSMKLMEMCLKLLPSKNAYPKGDTDIKYYNMVTEWFNSVFDLKSNKQYCDLKRIPTKTVSLALQIQSKKVISKCDFVLLFVTMLRSLGLQCRLVINFAIPPLRPPQKDLFVVSTKPKDNADAESTEPIKDKSKTLAKKIKVSTEKMKDSFNDVKKTIKSKDTEKATESKSSKSSMSKSHTTSENPPIKKVKVNVSRMSQSFIEKNTAEPTSKCAHEKPSNISKHSPHSSPSKSKKIEVNHTSNKSSPIQVPISPEVNVEMKKSNENDNAAPSQGNSKKQSQTVKSSKVLIGTPTKHKLVERTKSPIVSSNAAALKNKQTKKAIVVTMTTHSPRKTRSKSARNGEVTNVSMVKSKLELPQLDGADDIPAKKNAKGKAKAKAKAKGKTKPRPKQNDGSNSDSDFAPSPPKRVRAKITPQKPVNKALARAKQIDRRVFSTDEEIEDDSSANRMNFWVEAYAEKEKKWVVIDPVKKKVDCADYVRKNASKPIIYVLAWNNDNTIRDVTPRYCSQFHTSTRKLRAEQLWIDEALEKFLENRNPRTIIEDVEFSKMHMDTPMPTSINEFKNHPLYALERHLLKFEAIYPPNALTLGYIRKEPIYARECVHSLHSREIWVKQARTVKVGEKPYKIVKARPKWNRVLNQMEEAKPLEIFGIWQTEPYQPPVAENGVVPRNPYGNVELFKPEMLPIGTRHIPLPNLNRVCKKMGVDCAQAVIGFDFHGGRSHPEFDGFVVCEEFADDVIKQWEIDQEEQIRKETEKREARVFGNWKKLIKGLLIRERLKRKFNFGAEDSAEKPKKRKKE